MDNQLLERIKDLSGLLEADDSLTVGGTTLPSMDIQDRNPVGKIREFLPSQVDSKQAYTLFKDTYEQIGGTSWTYAKFMSRFGNWRLIGNEKGFVAYRPQRSGLNKLVGAGGSGRSIIAGVIKLLQTGRPVWGMVSDKIRNMAEKGGMLSPSPEGTKAIFKVIADEVFGNEPYTLNSDGSVTFHYSDIGDQTKWFVANKEYYKWLMQQARTKLDYAQISKLLGDGGFKSIGY